MEYVTILVIYVLSVPFFLWLDRKQRIDFLKERRRSPENITAFGPVNDMDEA